MTFYTDMVDNIETVLTDTLSLNLADLSAIDQNNWGTDALAQLLYTGTEFGDNLSERPLVDFANFTVKIGFRDEDPASARDKQISWTNSLRDNLTQANIDTGSNLVRWVIFNDAPVTYDGTYSTIYFNFTVRYRRT